MSDTTPPAGDPTPDPVAEAGAVPPPPPPPPAYPAAVPPAPAYAAPTGEQPLSQSDERLWAMLAHLSELVVAIIGPLLVLLILGKRSAFVDDQSKEALNFQISLLIAAVVSGLLILVVVGIFMLIAVALYGLIFAIIAAIKSYNGELYRYPLTIRFIK
jgi:uncharacterized Tic20 family protein